MGMERADVLAARLAERQHGLVTRRQAIEVGMSRGAIRHRLSQGLWVGALPGVYRVTGAPASWEARVLARTLAAGPEAVASHRTAACLWGFDGARRGLPELTIAAGRRYHGPPGARVHRSSDLHLVAPVWRSGVPTTPVGRTLLDLGGVVPGPLLHLAVDDARRRRLVDWDGLLDVLVAHARRGRRGVGALRRLLDEHAAELAATDSGFERLAIALLRTAGLPAPVMQYEVVTAVGRFRLDLAYPEPRVGIELDGSIHLRRDVWEADHARQNALVLAGWTILRFTWRDYTRRPTALVGQVREALQTPVTAQPSPPTSRGSGTSTTRSARSSTTGATGACGR
jgi:very-short-patch-repair endonuclease